MKIDKPSKPFPTSPAGEIATNSPARGKSSPPPSAQPSSTSVSLGSTAAQLSNLENSMMNSPVINASKVAEIKQAISEGRFKVNSGVVADRLIETVRDLIGGRT
jgi:negative regulator of flagellin synthesis FlgM